MPNTKKNTPPKAPIMEMNNKTAKPNKEENRLNIKEKKMIKTTA